MHVFSVRLCLPQSLSTAAAHVSRCFSRCSLDKCDVIRVRVYRGGVFDFGLHQRSLTQTKYAPRAALFRTLPNRFPLLRQHIHPV